MSASKLRLLKGFSQSVLSLSLCAIAFLQGCGKSDSAQQQTTEQSATAEATARDVSVAKENIEPTADAFEGTWQRSCVPDGGQSAEKLILNDGTFTREFVTYENNCSVKKDTFTTSGTFVLGDAALNTLELVYENGNFTLKPASVQAFRNIDFTIEGWTFSMSSALSGQDDADIAALKAECPALDVRKENTTLVIQRNGCTLKNLSHHNYDIATVQDDRLTTGIYINDLNSFDPAGGTTPELRNNVMSSNHMSRVEKQ